MKKIFSILAAALMGVSAMAATTITLSSSSANTATTVGDYTVTFAAGPEKSDVAPAWNEKSGHLRVYPNGTITVTGKGISRIDLPFTMGRTDRDYIPTLTANCGALVSGGKSTSDTDVRTDVWTGSADEVVFTLSGAGQRALKSIIINGDGTVPTPSENEEEQGGEQGGGSVDGYKLYKMAEAYNYGDYMADNTENITIYMYDDETSGVYTQLDLLVPSGTGYKIPAGTYNITDDLAVKTAVAGFYDEDNMEDLGCWVYGSGDEDYWDLDEGKVTVSVSGSTYTILVDATCSYEGKSFKIGYKGALTVEDGEIIEDGDDDDDDVDPVPAGSITVAKALEIGSKLADGAETAETYTVVGYVGKLDKPYDAEKKDQCWFMCDDKAEVGSDAYFNFEAYWCYIDSPVALGDYVSVTGKLMKYKKTIEIKNGQAKKLSAPQGIENAENEVVLKKIIEDGQLIIRRGEKLYNVMGQSL